MLSAACSRFRGDVYTTHAGEAQREGLHRCGWGEAKWIAIFEV